MKHLFTSLLICMLISYLLLKLESVRKEMDLKGLGKSRTDFSFHVISCFSLSSLFLEKISQWWPGAAWRLPRGLSRLGVHAVKKLLADYQSYIYLAIFIVAEIGREKSSRFLSWGFCLSPLLFTKVTEESLLSSHSRSESCKWWNSDLNPRQSDSKPTLLYLIPLPSFIYKIIIIFLLSLTFSNY